MGDRIAAFCAAIGHATRAVALVGALASSFPHLAVVARATRYCVVVTQPEVRNAELYTVSCDEVVVTFSTDPGVAVECCVGDITVTSVGQYHHVTFRGLNPETEYSFRVDGVVADSHCPSKLTTLARPSGARLARFATVNDVHFGERIAGLIGSHAEVGPVFTRPSNVVAYPNLMNAAAIDEIKAGDFDAVVVKGDLTSRGTRDEYDEFLNAYGVFGESLHHVRGNHDTDRTMNIGDTAPFSVLLDGAVLAVLDTSQFHRPNGVLDVEQLAWLDALAASATDPVLVFGHHPLWDSAKDPRSDGFFGLVPDSTDALCAVFARREMIAGYFAGHTHRNRVLHFPHARNIPIVEVASVKEYPGAWAEYHVYEGGYVQIGRRISAPDAMQWSEATRGLYANLYHDYALGRLSDRSFTWTSA